MTPESSTHSSKKPFIIGIIVLVIAVLAWFYFSQPASESGVAGTRALSGEVTEVNLDQMAFDGPARITFKTDEGTLHTIAVPSMGRPLCVANETIAAPESAAIGDRVEVSGTVGEDGAIVPCENATDYLRITGEVSDAALGVSFSYRKGPQGYVLEPLPAGASADKDFVKGYMLTLEKDYLELQSATAPREGPPTIAMRAYKNPERLWATLWPEKHPQESNIELALAEPSDTVVGGANAVTYTADGLYATDTYVVATGSYVYVFTGAYIDESSPQRADLKAMIESVVFTPEKD